MHECFKEAAALEPQISITNYDSLRVSLILTTMDESAIAAWEVLLNEFGARSDDEIDYIKISKARILLSMKRVVGL